MRSWTAFARRARRISTSCRKAAGSCSSNSDPTTRAPAREAARTVHRADERPATAPEHAPVHERLRPGRCGRFASRDRGRRRPLPARRSNGKGGTMRPSRPEKLGGYLRDLRALLDEYHYRTAFYGHFGHGCIHMRVDWDLETEAGIRKYGEFVERAADLVVSYGGSLSGEHGDGQSRGALLPRMFGDRRDAGVRRVQGRLGSGQPDEPPQGGGRATCRPKNLQTRRRLRPAEAGDTFRVSRRSTDRSNGRPCDASGWANAASATTGRCARATW